MVDRRRKRRQNVPGGSVKRPPEGERGTTQNLLGQYGFAEIDRIEVNRWHPLPNCEGPPTQVFLIVYLKQPDVPPMVMRFKSRRALNEIIEGLMRNRDIVFPEPEHGQEKPSA